MPESMKRKTVLWVVTILLMVMIFQAFSGKNSISMHGSDNGLVANCGQDKTFMIRYDGMTDIALRSEFDMGSPVDGVNRGNLRYGTWNNTELGKYTAAVSVNIPDYIVIHSTDGSYVINLENSDSTEALYKQLLKIMNED